jgi:MscS family membrane protein
MPRGSSLRWLFLAAALVLLVASVVAPMVVVADGPPGDRCNNPREAADSLFVAPRPELSCVDAKPGERARLARQLKQILDARGLYVPVATLAEEPDFQPEDGTGRIQLLPVQAPWLVLERTDEGDWLYSRATMNQVPQLYGETFSGASLWFQSILPQVFQQRIPWIGGYGWQYLLGVILIVSAVIIGLVVRLLVLSQLQRLALRLKLNVDRAVLKRLDNPVMVLVIGGIIAWRLPDLQLPIDASRTTYILLSIVLGLAGILAASRLVDVFTGFWEAKTAETESRLDDQLVPLVRQISRIIVWVIGILFVLQNNGVQVWSFVAGLGIGSLAFALAAQDTVANLFGALNIFLDKPFQIGDWVRVGDVEGTIEEVGFRSFRVRTFYNSLVTIPNSVITNTHVDNMGARHRRRVKTTLGLTYDTPPDKVQAFVEGVRAVLAAHPKVQKTYEVHFYDFGASSLDILVYYHVVVESFTEELETRAANFLEFIRVAEELGVAFAFPSTSVYLESTPDKPLPPHPSPPIADLEATAARFGPGGDAARPGGVPFTKSWAASRITNRGGE